MRVGRCSPRRSSLASRPWSTPTSRAGIVQGRPFDNRAIYLLELDDTGKWSALRTMDMDHEKINRFWSAVTIPDGVGAR